MAETRFQDLSPSDRRDALEVVERNSSHKAHLLEKDLWVVATLEVLFDAPFAGNLIFKGGTSLSKVWRAIRRFSEDIDITYDIRAFAPDLVSGTGEEALPPTRSQEKRWTRFIRARLVEWIRDQALEIVEEGLTQAGFLAQIRAEGDRLYIGYEPLFAEAGFVRPEVMVEFGARSTGEPHKVMPVLCNAAAHLPEIEFPGTCPTVMLAERTFWEKATAIHVFCRQERRRGQRLSRHWHDLARLDEAGIAANALADHTLAFSVARHKALFFSEHDARGNRNSACGHPYVQLIVPRVLELTYTSAEMEGFANDLGFTGPPFPWDEERRHCIRCELDAVFAQMYGLTRSDLEWILDPQSPSSSFPSLKQNELRSFGEYRTKRYVLRAFDLLERGQIPALNG